MTSHGDGAAGRQARAPSWKEHAHDDDHADAEPGRDRHPPVGSRPPCSGRVRDVWAMTRRNLVHISRSRCSSPTSPSSPSCSPCCSSTSSAGASRSRRRQLQGLRPRRAARAEPGHLDHGHCGRAQHRSARGHDRPVPHPADVAGRGAGGPVHRRPHDVVSVRAHRGPDRPGRRLAGGCRRPLGHRRASPCCSSSPTRCRGSRPASASTARARNRLHRSGSSCCSRWRSCPMPWCPRSTCPDGSRPIADWNPVSAVTAGARDLWGNPNPSGTIQAWPMQHPVEAALIWSAVILAVAAPLASYFFRRRTTE